VKFTRVKRVGKFNTGAISTETSCFFSELSKLGCLHVNYLHFSSMCH